MITGVELSVIPYREHVGRPVFQTRLDFERPRLIDKIIDEGKELFHHIVGFRHKTFHKEFSILFSGLFQVCHGLPGCLSVGVLKHILQFSQDFSR